MRHGTADSLLSLQRSAGNAAVGQLLHGRSLQRSPESAALLTKLAKTPKVGKGQATEVQTQVVDRLEELVAAGVQAKRKDWFGEPSELHLGGVLIDRLPNAGGAYSTATTDPEARNQAINTLYGQLTADGGQAGPAAKFVTLQTGLQSGAGIRSIGNAFGEDVKKNGLDVGLVQNTLKTMLDAEQLEYLRLAGLPNDNWKILVEMHYIRARPKDMAGFHKDTQGQSLFVNLNYHVPGRDVRGPEFIVNPPKSTEHDKRILGTGGKPATLPKEFTDDLAHTRATLGDPTEIQGAGTVKPLGYVGFVDEAIHHATPWFGGRYVTPTEFQAYLERTNKNKFDEIAKAEADYKKRSFLSSSTFAKYVKQATIPLGEIDKWRAWLQMATVDENAESKRKRLVKYTRENFAATMQPGEFEAMLQDVGSQSKAERNSGGAGGWYAASIPSDGTQPVQPEGKPPLTRQGSSANLTQNWPAQLPDDVPRRFIRSWVRAIPASLADTVRRT